MPRQVQYSTHSLLPTRYPFRFSDPVLAERRRTAARPGLPLPPRRCSALCNQPMACERARLQGETVRRSGAAPPVTSACLRQTPGAAPHPDSRATRLGRAGRLAAGGCWSVHCTAAHHPSPPQRASPAAWAGMQPGLTRAHFLRVLH